MNQSVKIRLNDQFNADVEQRRYTAGGTFPSGKGMAVDIRCPFCHSQVTAPITRLTSIGQNCNCGALFGVKGLAIRLKPVINNDLS